MTALRGLACFAIATVLWLSCVHLLFERDPDAIARPLAERQLELWAARGERGGEPLETNLAALRADNPEWDLMARTFAVLAFANLALRESAEQERYLAVIDAIIDRTLHDVETHGTHYFLLPYGQEQPFVDPAARSVFVDGELALMLAARELVAPSRPQLARTWVDRARGQIERAPALLAESYPDEVWLFCNAVALAAVRVHDAAEGVPDRHAALFARWVASARRTLVDPGTGLLVAKTSYAGEPLEGPEGSTLWLAAAMLVVVDDDFARDQYRRARDELRDGVAGFGWAREWPASWPGRDDVDSGPTIPIVGANAGLSGLALVAARTFDDAAFTDDLVTTLQFAGFPVDGGASYAAGNQLADAVMLYALVAGPLWERVR